MACEWDEIPDPNCFESCTPAPTCGSCDVGNIFKYPNPPLPGVPCGRVAVPLVRINGQIQDLNAGGFIPNQFIEPPFLSYDPNSGFLNVGGRFVKISEGTNMAQSDCHGQQIGPCTPIMTCTNFAEIIGASTGVGFKNPSNPFAGLTIFLKENSGLVLDGGGLGINWNILCSKLQELGCSTSPTPTPDPDPGPGPSPTPDPDPEPTPTPTDQSRSGIPFYTCHNAANNQVEDVSGTVSLTWYASTGVITVSGGTAGTKYFYSGSANAASQIGSTLGSGYTLMQFNAITMVALDSVCAETPPDPEPDPDPNPDPDPTPSTVTLLGGCGASCPPTTLTLDYNAATQTVNWALGDISSCGDSNILITVLSTPAFTFNSNSGATGVVGGVNQAWWNSIQAQTLFGGSGDCFG